MKIHQSDFTTEYTADGYLLISYRHGDTLYKRKYSGYTKQESLRMFREYLEEELKGA